jgi:hypothetical protein
VIFVDTQFSSVTSGKGIQIGMLQHFIFLNDLKTVNINSIFVYSDPAFTKQSLNMFHVPCKDLRHLHPTLNLSLEVRILP